MIIEVEGDILLSDAFAVVQGVGINDPMDKGLALELRSRYPDMCSDFNRWCHQHNTKPGEAWLWTGPDNVHVVNLITQDLVDCHDYPTGKATLANVRHALDALAAIVKKENITSLALPKLATGAGDLDWDDVLPLIESFLGVLDIPVYVYAKYLPGRKGKEPME
ncbi:MAG: macro domain-containing protein [Gammaproteobacteria bacterium]